MLKLIVYYLNIFFMYYVFINAMILFISTIYSILNLDEKKMEMKYLNELEMKNNKYSMPVSILVPAYNEESTVVDCINSLLHLDYPDYEIIIIDDGSSDCTSEVLINTFRLNKIKRPIRKSVKCKKEKAIYEKILDNDIKITLVKKENGGKADALNMGINLSKYPLFITLDADSILQNDSISNIVVPFMEDETTIAVGGNIKVSNSIVLQNGNVVKVLKYKRPLVIFQTIEYYRVFLTTRVWFNSFNGNLIISGAFGLFKKNAVINVGGYNTNTVGEDMDLVVKLHSFYRKNKLPYKIKYSHNSICWSQVPEKLRDLKKQRKRWHNGLITSLLDHKYILLNPKYGIVGVFSFLYFIVYEMFSCVIDIFGLSIVAISYFSGLLNMEFLFTFLLVYMSYGIVISITSIILDNYMFSKKLKLWELLKLILFAIIENFGYRQLCSWYRITGFVGYRKSKHQWEKISRKKQNKIFNGLDDDLLEEESGLIEEVNV